MFIKRYKTVIGVSLVLVLFSAGLIRLFQMRFEAGDLYPMYSSLRADPLGTQAFYESLEMIADHKVSRNFRPLDQVKIDSDTTLFILGLNRNSFLQGNKWNLLMDNLAENGGRVVISFYGHETPVKKEGAQTAENNETVLPTGGCPEMKEDDAADDAEDKYETTGSENKPDFTGVSGWNPGIESAAESGASENIAWKTEAAPDFLPESIFWKSLLMFRSDDPSWETVYSSGGESVIMTRSWGNGTLILAADAYLFSNEALRKHRMSTLLAWTAGPTAGMIFDESHKGLVRSPGVSELIVKYRLHGVAASLVFIMILLIWRQAALMPVTTAVSENGRDHLRQDALAGWVNLVRQHISSRDLLKVCHEAWVNSEASRDVSREKLAQIRLVVSGHDAETGRKDLIFAFGKISQLLLKQGRHI